VRLTRKLVFALVAGIVLVMAAGAALQLRREIALFEDDMARDEEAMGRVLQVALERVANDGGPEAAVAAVDLMRESETRVGLRWVWLDQPDPSGRVPTDLRDRLATTDAVHVVRDDGAGDERQFTYVPVRVPGNRPAVVELSEPLRFQRNFLRRTELQVLGTLAVLIVLGAAGAMWIGVILIGRPLRQLTEQARRIGTGDLSRRITLRQRDEIGTLARELNATCERLSMANERVRAETEARIAALEQLRHADRLKTVGQLASAMAHELGTPLNVVGGRAKLIASGDLTPGEIDENAQIIAGQADRMAGIIRQLLDFARRRDLKRATGDLREVVRRTVEMLAVLARTRRVTVSLDAPDFPVPVATDAGQLQQALANVLVNGIQAMPSGGRLRVGIERDAADRGPAGYRIVVEDEGVGIAPEHVPHLFEPFFTTKGVGEGTGLGLAVAYGIVAEHGGRIDVTSKPGRGSRFEIVLPAEPSIAEKEAV
jgi:two-component system NtrC family sensor kinase